MFKYMKNDKFHDVCISSTEKTPHFEILDTPKSLSPDWLRMQSDFYLCSTGLLEGRREAAFRKEKCFTKFFYDSEADWGNHRFEQWGKKDLLT